MIRRKKKSQSDKRKELFISIINSIEQIINRQTLMYAELQLDFASYDEAFLDTIDALIILHFGKECAEVVGYYLWERLNPDGTINPLLDENDNVIILENASDLWNLLLKLNPKSDE